MKAFSGLELYKNLKGDGWRLLRIQGSHYVHGEPGSSVRLSVPVHGNSPLGKKADCLRVGIGRYQSKRSVIRRFGSFQGASKVQ
jgi:predicted RNA binding protein YcfA (HicA-like mRNA interferase family)